MSGFDLPGLLTKIEILGMTMSAMILMRSVFEKETAWGFGVSIVYKLYWLVVLFFILGLGSVENLGVAVIGGSTSNTSNIVMFDFRLISFLATIIVSLMIAHSFIEFREKSSPSG
jgi:hypothetical protein